MSFFESAFLWREAVIASALLAMALSVTGIFVILRRVVFLPAALSQVSGLGVVLSFFAAFKLPELSGSPITNPFLVALVVTLAAAVLLGSLKEPKRLSREAITGMAYVIASGLIVAIGALVPNESHAVSDVLFGNAVMVSPAQMAQAVAVSILVLSVHGIFARVFLFTSLDPETAKAQGVPTAAMDGLLFLVMGLIISVATKTIGAMPVFAFSVLPSAAALQFMGRTRSAFIAAPLLGAVSAFVGYYVSFTFDLPTGACAVVTAGGFFIVSLAGTRLKSWLF